jgi:5,10-methylene-tetrahydrofolate dehydrogenase/methenyl tetrahydrofolate cyclohydrolase
MEECKMETTMQTLLGKILRNRINAELKKEVKDFTTIQETMDIFLAGDKLTAEQYAEFTELITPTTVAP